MTLLEKIKVNLNYMLGKADSKLYKENHKSLNLTLRDWQNRWEIFSDHGCGFVWYGVDSEENIAQFICDNAYIPEAFFEDVSDNQQLHNFFETLPEVATTQLPENLRPELKRVADNFSGVNDFWKTGANKGLYIFEETDDETWYKHYRKWNNVKYPYELLLIPSQRLRIVELPNEIQQLLAPYHFQNLRFRDCQFLDVSKYFYCEE
jgi:hypothetical protein